MIVWGTKVATGHLDKVEFSVTGSGIVAWIGWQPYPLEARQPVRLSDTYDVFQVESGKHVLVLHSQSNKAGVPIPASIVDEFLNRPAPVVFDVMLATPTIVPRGAHLTTGTKRKTVTISYGLAVGGCDRYKVRGFVLVDGKPDLSKNPYEGAWGSLEEAEAELDAIAEGKR